MKIKELPLTERPYEKLEIYGAESLSNAELLAIIIKTGTKEQSAVSIAQNILKLNEQAEQENLRFLQEIALEEFMKIKGIGKVKPINQKKPIIKTPKDVADMLIPELRYEKQEKVKVLILNSKNKVLKTYDVSFGGSNFAYIEPKDVLAEAIKMQAPKIILVHNHPSGDAKPSKGDYKVTDRIYEAAQLMGIQLLDHIIIGDGLYQSLLLERK